MRGVMPERSSMTKRKTRQVALEQRDDETPAWMNEDASDRSTPYTEEELDLLVEGTLESIRDTSAWKKLVSQVGKDEARRVLRSRLIMNDENAGKLPRH
jgi:hypothetical protein